jgi:glycerol-3-phosphate acyltransferase PlsX
MRVILVNQNIISVDAMGGDNGPGTVLPALAQASELHPDVRFLIFGQEEIVRPVFDRFPILHNRSTVSHCDVAITMDEKPGAAVRRGRRESSMWRAIEAVKNGEAQAAVSAGNTGALMAMSKVILRTIPGIERPALAAIWPTLKGECVVLDVGATIDITPAQYVQFAIMGQAYARCVLGFSRPRIGILNVGVEDVKGSENIRDAAGILHESDLNFIGFVEGDGIGRGDADVVVTDGFTGNVALKTAEGTARQFATMLRESMASNLFGKLGYLLAYRSFAALREKLDPNASNGGMFLGVNGIVVKSHGSADVGGYCSAVEVAVEVAKADMAHAISQDVEEMRVLLENAWAERLD